MISFRNIRMSIIQPNWSNPTKQSLSPTSMEIEYFASDLLAQLENLIEKVGRIHARDFKSVKSSIPDLITKLTNNWENFICFDTVSGEEKGANFIFKGAVSQYLIPALFWEGRHSIEINLTSFKRWLVNFPPDISWDEFQIQLSDLLHDEKLLQAGLTRHRLEILRFFARLNLVDPHIIHSPNPELRWEIFKAYTCLYDLDLTSKKQLNKNFKSITDQHSYYDAIPLPIPWNLDCVVIDPRLIYVNDQLTSLPIWTFKGQTDNNLQSQLAIHRIPAGSIGTNNPLYNGLVRNMFFFWNFNQKYEFSDNSSKKSRSFLTLKSPETLFEDYKNQNYLLNDSLTEYDNTALFEPDWELKLDFPFPNKLVSTNMDSGDLFFPKTRQLIKSFNTRYVDGNRTFFNQFEEKNSSNHLDSLFSHRLYFYGLPPSQKGLIWIPLSQQSTNFKQTLIPFLKAWLHSGCIIDYNTGLLVITYFPIRGMNPKYVQSVYNFFEKLGTKISLFLPQTIDYFSAFSIYSLPESRHFDTDTQSWKLPKNNIHITLEEKINIINNIIENERK